MSHDGRDGGRWASVGIDFGAIGVFARLGVLPVSRGVSSTVWTVCVDYRSHT